MNNKEKKVCVLNQKYQSVLTINGYPLRIYHRTTAEVEKFLPFTHFASKSTVENVSFNPYATYPDSKTLKDSSYVMPAYLFISNPKLLSFSAGGTVSDWQKSFVKELVQEQFGDGLSCYMACQENVFNKNRSAIARELFDLFQYKKDYAFIFQNPYQLKQEDVLRELKLETMFANVESHSEETTAKYLVMQRLVRFWEKKGFDGFVYPSGLYKAYVTFRPQQIKRLDRSFTDWHLTFPSKDNESKLSQIYQATTAEKQTQLSLQELVFWEKCLTEVSLRNKSLKINNQQMKSYQNLTINHINQRG